MRTIPGNRTYASTTKYGQKIILVGDSHVKSIRRNLFNKSIVKGKSHIKAFSGSNAKQLNHHIISTLEDDKPDIVIVHVGSNDVNNYNYREVNPIEVAQRIIDIGKTCKNYGVKEVCISSILMKRNIYITKKIHELNDSLKHL